MTKKQIKKYNISFEDFYFGEILQVKYNYENSEELRIIKDAIQNPNSLYRKLQKAIVKKTEKHFIKTFDYVVKNNYNDFNNGGLCFLNCDNDDVIMNLVDKNKILNHIHNKGYYYRLTFGNDKQIERIEVHGNYK